MYDCGSLSGKELIKEQIHRCFDPGEIIHAVFISHFDEDHVNGLEYLLKYGRVEHIFFPLLTEEDKLLGCLFRLAGSAFADENSFWFQFMLNPSRALSRLALEYTPILHPVRSGDEDAESRGTPDGDPNWRTYMVRSGENVSKWVFGLNKASGADCQTDWLYVSFHFREKPKREKLKAILSDSLGTSDPDELLELLESNPLYRLKIKEAYKKIPGSFNANSMTLFSGTERADVFQIYKEKNNLPPDRELPWIIIPPLMMPGALYMGDYEAEGARKWLELTNAYGRYFKYTGCLQVPHHGSIYYFNFELLNIESCGLYIISAGLDNEFQHPDGGVVKQIVLSGKRPLVVSEQAGSEASFEILSLASSVSATKKSK